ncbi:MAG: succinylglutamate desuccinylase/aspartoacylase family protein [Lewinellaceae bacterium]|nr:succinylglutamate desuccinylase/aspartoacylase family protein [Lewinellaceae bacterium]
MKSAVSCLLLLSAILPFTGGAQMPVIRTVETLDLAAIPPGTTQRLWVHVFDNAFTQPIYVPVIVAKGNTAGPVVGLTAAIHGDELNGIPIIQQLFADLDPQKIRGTVVGVPGLNAVSLQREQRRFPDDEDLNRNFPGAADGTNSEQYNHLIFDKIIRHFNYLFDLHTASFGRINTLYVRADLKDSTLAQLAYLQDADIILNSAGPSAGNAGAGRTLRTEAYLAGIPCITIEFGNPQVYQADMIARGTRGMRNGLRHLGILPLPFEPVPQAVICKKSYWIYVDAGGLLEVPVDLNQQLNKGDVIGILRNPFGDVVKEYTAPEAGIVIGKSTNPVNINGGRIIHLGILR